MRICKGDHYFMPHHSLLGARFECLYCDEKASSDDFYIEQLAEKDGPKNYIYAPTSFWCEGD